MSKANHMPTAKRNNARSSEDTHRDRGLILPLVLVLTVVLGAVVVAIATYATTTLRAGSAVESRVDRLAATDAGMQIALEKLRTREAGCITSNQVIYSGTVNRQPVAVSCQRTTINAADIGKFAVVVTAEGVPVGTSSFNALGTNVSTKPRSIGGNVYLARPPAALDKPVQVTEGDIYYFSGDMSCKDPTYGVLLQFKPIDERGYVCTSDTWQTMFQQPPLPTKNTSNRIATGKTNAKGCTVFQPGVYKKPPVIGAGTQNFFEPGTYSFEFDGELQIKNAVVTAGTSGPAGTGSSPVARTSTTFASPWCATAINAFNTSNNTNTGVTWILSDKSRITVDPNGQVELFAPQSGSPTQMMSPSIVALQSSTTQYIANTLGASGPPLIDLQEGSSNGIVIHGGVWAPTASINLGNIAQSANGQFLGGVVVASLNLQTAASAGNFNLRVVTTSATKRVVLTSISGITTTRVVALIRASTGSYAIESRRVE